MALSIKDIKTKLGGFFQRKLKNLITLGNDSTLESDLKPIKVGDDNTPIEVSETEVRVSGTINADAINVGGSAVQTGTDAGATELNELSDVTYSSGDLTITSLDKIISGNLTIDSSGDIELNADGGDITLKDALSSMALFNIGSTRFYYDSNNLFRITCGATGIATLSTEGGTATDADFVVDAGGDITLDSGTGIFIAKKTGTEFSATNSAYAGMILGYTCLLNDAADDSYSVSDVYVVPDADMKVVFVAPPSGNVEIFVSIYAKSSATRQLEFGLSDNTTYNTIDVTHEHEVWNGNTSEETQLQHQWVITGLTAGTSYTYSFGTKASQTGRITLHWGGDATGEYAPFIMKATALPATLHTE